MSTIIRRFISYVGKVKLSDFKDPTHITLVDKYCKDQETRDPRIKQACIQGTELHISHKDPTDPLKVISVQFLDENGKKSRNRTSSRKRNIKVSLQAKGSVRV